MSEHSHDLHGRHGARQPAPFDPARAGLLDDPKRFEYMPPDEIFAMLDAPRDGVVVDFGAGTGVYAIELARRRPDLQVVAIDEQPQMLELLRAKPAAAELPNLRTALADEPAMAALKDSVDRVLAINVLHELGDQAISSMVELIRPGGAALVVDWNAEGERPIGPPAAHVYAPGEARQRLEAFGLRVEHERMLPYHFVIRGRRV